MPNVRVGERIVRFPDTMSQEEIQAAVKKIAGQKTSKLKFGESAARGALQGLTLGFGDEMAGGLDALLGTGNAKGVEGGIGDRYKAARDAYRQRNERAREGGRAAYMAGELGGGAGAGGIGMLARGVGRLGAKEAAKRAAGVGAGEGAAAGVGYSDEMEDAPVGAGIGAALGGVLGPAGVVAGRGLSRVREQIGKKGAEKKAGRILNKDMKGAGIDADEVDARLAQDENLMIADTDPGLRERLGVIAGGYSDVARTARNKLDARHEGQADRVRTALRGALQNEEAVERAAQVSGNLRKTANDLYQEAYQSPVRPTTEMGQVLKTPAGKLAVTTASRNLKNLLPKDQHGEHFIKTARGEKLNFQNLQVWDEIQRALGDKYSTAAKSKPKEARRYLNLQKGVVNGLEASNPTFRAARKIYREEKDDIEAIDLGKKAFREKMPELQKNYGELSDSEKWHFKTGVFDAIDNELGKKGAGDDISRVFKSENRRNVLRLAFDDPNEFRKFYQSLGNEEEMVKTFRVAANKSLLDDVNMTPDMPPLTAAQFAHLMGRKALANAPRKLGQGGKQVAANTLMGRNTQLLRQPQGMGPGGQAMVGAIPGAVNAAFQPLLPTSQPPLPR